MRAQNTLADKKSQTHHGVLSEGLDLLDGAGSALLEGNTVNLYYLKIRNQSSARYQLMLESGH